VDCTSEAAACRYTANCPTHEPIQNVHRKFQQFMADYTLDEIIGTRAAGGSEGPFHFQLG
jgi:DNA-binding IscR family transcriptional regulator